MCKYPFSALIAVCATIAFAGCSTESPTRLDVAKAEWFEPGHFNLKPAPNPFANGYDPDMLEVEMLQNAPSPAFAISDGKDLSVDGAGNQLDPQPFVRITMVSVPTYVGTVYMFPALAVVMFKRVLLASSLAAGIGCDSPSLRRAPGR